MLFRSRPDGQGVDLPHKHNDLCKLLPQAGISIDGKIITLMKRFLQMIGPAGGVQVACKVTGEKVGNRFRKPCFVFSGTFAGQRKAVPFVMSHLSTQIVGNLVVRVAQGTFGAVLVKMPVLWAICCMSETV